MRVDIYMMCPACYQQGYSVAKEYWCHGGSCGGVLQLDEYANVVCKRCGRKAPLMQMRLTCNSGRHTFYVPTLNGYVQAITMAGMAVDKSGMAWLQSVLRYIQT